VLKALLVLNADVLHYVGAGRQLGGDRCGPGLFVGIGIIDRDLHLQVAEIAPVDPLGDAERFGMGVTDAVELCLVVEPCCLNDERIPLPAAH
jgi:hypothetical protein